MNGIKGRQINVIKILEPISYKIGIDRHLVNQITKENNINSNAQNLDLNGKFRTFPLVQAHELKNSESVIMGHLNENFLNNKFAAIKELI